MSKTKHYIDSMINLCGLCQVWVDNVANLVCLSYAVGNGMNSEASSVSNSYLVKYEEQHHIFWSFNSFQGSLAMSNKLIGPRSVTPKFHLVASFTPSNTTCWVQTWCDHLQETHDDMIFIPLVMEAWWAQEFSVPRSHTPAMWAQLHVDRNRLTSDHPTLTTH